MCTGPERNCLELEVYPDDGPKGQVGCQPRQVGLAMHHNVLSLLTAQCLRAVPARLPVRIPRHVLTGSVEESREGTVMTDVRLSTAANTLNDGITDGALCGSFARWLS
jgi:hypothetical protein